ncbi:unnamed protein product [Boreogadus saida]
MGQKQVRGLNLPNYWTYRVVNSLDRSLVDGQELILKGLKQENSAAINMMLGIRPSLRSPVYLEASLSTRPKPALHLNDMDLSSQPLWMKAGGLKSQQ